MRRVIKGLIEEKDKMRGMVPSRSYGSHDKVYGAYLRALDPYDNPYVQLALANSKDDRFRDFLDRVMTLDKKRFSLQSIAKACDIDLKEFTEWWNKESVQAAIAVFQQSSISVAKDMVKDAMSIDAMCERCDGLKRVEAPSGLPLDTPGYDRVQAKNDEGVTIILWFRACPVCLGIGTVRKAGDAHARDLVMEASGIVQRGKGIAIQVNTNFQDHASAVTNDGMTIDIDSGE